VSSCTVWLKTLNLALMGGTPQYIHLFLVVFVLPLFLFSRITFVFYFQRQNKGYFSSSLGVCYKPCQSKQFSKSHVSSFHVVTHWGQCAN
jgi:hypothetical protein